MEVRAAWATEHNRDCDFRVVCFGRWSRDFARDWFFPWAHIITNGPSSCRVLFS
jgi:hypothetical protein